LCPSYQDAMRHDFVFVPEQRTCFINSRKPRARWHNFSGGLQLLKQTPSITSSSFPYTLPKLLSKPRSFIDLPPLSSNSQKEIKGNIGDNNKWIELTSSVEVNDKTTEIKTLKRWFYITGNTKIRTEKLNKLFRYYSFEPDVQVEALNSLPNELQNIDIKLSELKGVPYINVEESTCWFSSFCWAIFGNEELKQIIITAVSKNNNLHLKYKLVNAINNCLYDYDSALLIFNFVMKKNKEKTKLGFFSYNVLDLFCTELNIQYNEYIYISKKFRENPTKPNVKQPLFIVLRVMLKNKYNNYEIKQTVIENNILYKLVSMTIGSDMLEHEIALSCLSGTWENCFMGLFNSIPNSENNGPLFFKSTSVNLHHFLIPFVIHSCKQFGYTFHSFKLNPIDIIPQRKNGTLYVPDNFKNDDSFQRYNMFYIPTTIDITTMNTEGLLILPTPSPPPPLPSLD